MSTSTPRRSLMYAAVVWALLASCLGGLPSAHAVDQTKGYPGFCRDGKGVTVVVDFQQLGGETLVRCNPSGERGTGLDALKGAGFQIAGVQRWGESFICRIENRPSAIESVRIDTDPNYREQCINTPPAKAYWSYWHAGNNCAWQYSQWGVKNRDFIQGGFEGWSFSLNASADTNPRPRIAAVRPGTEGGACQAKTEAGPTTNDPNERQPGSVADNGYVPNPDKGSQGSPGGKDTANGGTQGRDGVVGSDPNDPDRSTAGQSGASGQQPGSAVQNGASGSGQPTGATPGSGSNPTSGTALPAPKPRATRATPQPENPVDDPAGNVAFSGGQSAPDVRDVIKAQSNASDLAPWAAGGAMLLLAILAMVTARRRRRLREDA